MIDKIQAYLTDVRAELAKVSWPSFQEMLGSTYVTIIVSTILAVFIFSVDRILTTIMSFLLQ